MRNDDALRATLPALHRRDSMRPLVCRIIEASTLLQAQGLFSTAYACRRRHSRAGALALALAEAPPTAGLRDLSLASYSHETADLIPSGGLGLTVPSLVLLATLALPRCPRLTLHVWGEIFQEEEGADAAPADGGRLHVLEQLPAGVRWRLRTAENAHRHSVRGNFREEREAVALSWQPAVAALRSGNRRRKSAPPGWRPDEAGKDNNAVVDTAHVVVLIFSFALLRAAARRRRRPTTTTDHRPATQDGRVARVCHHLSMSCCCLSVSAT